MLIDKMLWNPKHHKRFFNMCYRIKSHGAKKARNSVYSETLKTFSCWRKDLDITYFDKKSEESMLRIQKKQEMFVYSEHLSWNEMSWSQ